MILAALAGERSLDGLSGRPGSEPASEKVSRLEALAVRGAKEHLKLASDDPDLALKREKGWKAARAVACRGSHSESFSRMDAGYATAVKQAITLGHGRQPAVVPAVECAPKGIMRGVVFSKERQEGVAPAVVRQHVADLVDAPVAPELARERSRGRRESVSRVVKTVARGSGKALLYATWVLLRWLGT